MIIKYEKKNPFGVKGKHTKKTHTHKGNECEGKKEKRVVYGVHIT